MIFRSTTSRVTSNLYKLPPQFLAKLKVGDASQLEHLRGTSIILRSVRRTRMSTQVFRLDQRIWNVSLYKRVQDIWFSDIPEDARAPTKEAIKRWFGTSPEEKAAFDHLCRTEFDAALQTIGPLNYPIRGLSDEEAIAPFVEELRGSDDAENVRTASSLLILFDQVSRNIYRTKESLPMVYEHYDRLSVALINHIISTEPRLDQHTSIRYGICRRFWFYLPLMHSEAQQHHELTAELMDSVEQDLNEKGAEDCMPFLNLWRTHEQNHAKIIKQFGRYPHRNSALGRVPTKEEEEYLKAGGETFGVTT